MTKSFKQPAFLYFPSVSNIEAQLATHTVYFDSVNFPPTPSIPDLLYYEHEVFHTCSLFQTQRLFRTRELEKWKKSVVFLFLPKRSNLYLWTMYLVNLHNNTLAQSNRNTPNVFTVSFPRKQEWYQITSYNFYKKQACIKAKKHTSSR